MARAGLIITGLFFGLSPPLAEADSLVAAHNLPAQRLITAGDLLRVEERIEGALVDPAEAVGFETRVAVYAGRPLRAGDIGPPALVERNAIVGLEYRHGGLVIRAEGRALGRAGLGERVRVLNLSSKATISGRVGSDGMIHIGESP